jgi:hypothetical protein
MAPFPPVMVYDEAAERTVVFGDGRLAAYDATADRWENLNGSDDPDQGLPWFGRSSQLGLDTYDPVNERLVGRGGGDGLWAFEPATRQWTFLLEARDGVTVPTRRRVGSGRVTSTGLGPGARGAVPVGRERRDVHEDERRRPASPQRTSKSSVRRRSVRACR